jgi:hypothetical protein
MKILEYPILGLSDSWMIAGVSRDGPNGQTVVWDDWGTTSANLATAKNASADLNGAAAEAFVTLARSFVVLIMNSHPDDRRAGPVTDSHRVVMRAEVQRA